MIIIGVVAAVLVLGAAAAWGVARVGVAGVDAPTATQCAEPLPVGPLSAADLADLRFDQGLRGYRMRQVDQALARIADEIADRDEEITRLRLELEHRGAHAHPPLGAEQTGGTSG